MKRLLLLCFAVLLFLVFAMAGCKKSDSVSAPSAAPTATFTPGPDSFEPDDTFGTASTLTVGGAAQYHNLYTSTDIDYFKFSAVAGIQYLVSATYNPVSQSAIALTITDYHSSAENYAYYTDGSNRIPRVTIMPYYCTTTAESVFEVYNDSSSLFGSDCWYKLKVEAVPTPAIVNFNTAADNQSLTFSFSGTGLNWYGQSNISHDGGSALRSGWTNNNQETEFSTSVTGPCTVTFWWKVSSEGCCDGIEFYDDAVQQLSLYGENDWVQATYTIADSAAHTLTWEYSKDGSDACGYDAAWVDNIQVQ